MPALLEWFKLCLGITEQSFNEHKIKSEHHKSLKSKEGMYANQRIYLRLMYF